MRRALVILALGLGLNLAAPMARGQGAADVEAFRAGVQLARGGDWAGAEAALAQSGDLARDLMRWMRLRDGPRGPNDAVDPRDPDPTFAEYTALLAVRPHWPGLDRLRQGAERVIPVDAAPGAVIQFFAGGAPLTGEGAAALARAQRATGDEEGARATLSAAWLGLGMTNEGHAALMAGFAPDLAPLHAARVDAMLWRWRVSDAQRLIPLLPEAERLEAEARIALIRDTSDRTAALAALDAAGRDRPGVAVERFNRLIGDSDYDAAVAFLLERTDSAARLGEPFRWAANRAVMTRWLLRQGRGAEAYRLASRHHLAEGEFYVDLEWLAGYAALTRLGDPATAITHFRAAEAAARGPISLARTAYWIARAEEAAGRSEAAMADYARAAERQSAFYGLLAAERLGRPLDPALIAQEDFGDWRAEGLLQNDMTAALLMALAADAQPEALLFAIRLGQTLDRRQTGQLGAMLDGLDQKYLELTVAKAAQERGIVIPQMLFPDHDLARMQQPVSPELAMAIARQESEFNIAAGSGVGALGLMQLMPGTAEEVARELGLPYERARLTSDWRYNATLGTRYLERLQTTFGASPVMIAAGYNAGPGRPRTWIGERGDPRTGGADVLDWIEMIPFAETRNYVMRVTEAMPIYHARLHGQTGPTGFRALLDGRLPVVRPRARPFGPAGQSDVFVEATVEAAIRDLAVLPATPAPAAEPAAPSSALRPRARP